MILNQLHFNNSKKDYFPLNSLLNILCYFVTNTLKYFNGQRKKDTIHNVSFYTLKHLQK